MIAQSITPTLAARLGQIAVIVVVVIVAVPIAIAVLRRPEPEPEELLDSYRETHEP